MKETVRIGCGSGFWGDTPEGPAQLVRKGDVDYLVLDYLAEITMSILARMKAKNPAAGYATDFVTMVMKPLAKEIAEKKIKVVTNAGGVNPRACRDALTTLFAELGVDLKVGLVEGDDLSERAETYREAGVTEMFSGRAFPDKIASVNAYLGAFPIAAALRGGADIVLTGRCVDSALALGPLIHEFGWTESDHDLLSAGSLVGHVVECGAQATGGIVTDWRTVADGWDDMGFPVAECRGDGTFDLTKPEGTGGAVTAKGVAEQIVYEVGDPAKYVLPDVVCDWSDVRVTQAGDDRVRVDGARGLAPTSSYKVSATHADGYRSSVTMMVAGRDAAEKARAVAYAILARVSRLAVAQGLADFTETSTEILGAEASYGRVLPAREVVLKLAVRHADRRALEIFGREIYPAATAMAQGLTGFSGGRPEPQPVIRLFSFLADKADVPVRVVVGERTVEIATIVPPPLTPPLKGEGNSETFAPPIHLDQAHRDPFPSIGANVVEYPSPLWGGVRGGGTSDKNIPLIALAHGRSGDKGDIANIGVLARKPEFLHLLREQLTPEAVKSYFAHYAKGPVERFDWPGLCGFNVLLHEGLGGGGIASLRHDPQGKALAQILMDFPIAVPAAWLDGGGPLAGWTEMLDTAG